MFLTKTNKTVLTQNTFSNRFAELFSLLTYEQKLNHMSRIHLYKELLENTSVPELEDFFNSVLAEFRKYYQKELQAIGNEYYLYTAENLLYKWCPLVTKTIYQNSQNVHAFSKPAVRTAKLLIQEFQHSYFSFTDAKALTTVGAREEALEYFLFSPEIKKYLNLLESDSSYQGVFLTDLFAAVWFYTSKSGCQEFLRKRLLEEIKDSVDTCLSGKFIRLVNVINGVDENFSFTLQKTEYDKSYVFHQLNKLVDVCNWETITEQVQSYINDRIDVKNISPEEIINILQSYTKGVWNYVNGTYKPASK